ncbi:MAG: serine/threonine-protein kinase PknK [Myxococcota bacterium]
MSDGADRANESLRFPFVEGHEIDSFLGQGGMGMVYRARDSSNGRAVALKILKGTDPASVYRIKREFRVLSGITHPNLVRLFELNCGKDHWFFTMELVHGKMLLDHLGVPDPSGPALLPTVASSDAATQPSSAERQLAHAMLRPALDTAALRDRFRQIIEAVAAVHRASKLHCDIKPSNILVEDSGRVVVLDFGVSTSFDRSAQHSTEGGEIGGTPEYMSPEQASAKPIGPASDWYSVGVVLYQALCGQLPFSGPPLELMRRKQSELPLPPSHYASDVPRDLEELCMALLDPDPRRRPDANAVLTRLREVGDVRERLVAEDDVEFIGREHELRVLKECFASLSDPAPVLVLMSGESGIGKSALLQYFLRDISRERGVVVLAGRCYERESVPYKGFDALIDELSNFLLRLSDREVAEVLPRDIHALTRVFGVLKRIPAIAASRGRQQQSKDPIDVKRLAAQALRELLTRLADSWRLVIVIDDAQWGDEDSARLLSDILALPDAPALMAVVSARRASQSPMMREILREQHAADECRNLVRLELSGLPAPEATLLAASMLGVGQGGLAPLLVKEARGNPYFLRELSRNAVERAAWSTSSARAELSAVPLSTMLLRRLQLFSASHRLALELLAVASRPTPVALLSRALADRGVDAIAIWDDLRDAHFIRTAGAPSSLSIECFHDRVREALLEELSDSDRAEHHRNLVSVLEQESVADPEVLLEHYLGAGDRARAELYAIASAAAAFEALAFARAARLYRLAESLMGEAKFYEAQLGRALANVLASDGRLEEAAQVYLRCAERASGYDAIALRRVAAQHHLTAGNREFGTRALERALNDVGLKYPSTPIAALVTLTWERLKLRFNRLKFQERSASDADLARVDVCFSAAVGLAMTDLLRAAVFSALHLNLALRAGEPGRIARGLAFEMGIAPGAGKDGLRWASRALPIAERLSERHGTAYHRGLFFLAQGHVAYLNGQWRASVDWLARAETMLRESQTPEVHWAVLSGYVLSLISSVTSGDLTGTARRLPGLFAEARTRGELHRLALMAYPAVLLELARDRPQGGLDLVAELKRGRGAGSFDLRDFTLLHCSLLVARYNGNELQNWETLQELWPTIARSQLLVVNVVRVAALAERGSAALAFAERSGSAAARRLAVQCANKLRREALAHASALAGLLRARIFALRGDQASALAELTETSLRLDTVGMLLLAHCTRLVCASLMEGTMAGMLASEADSWLRAQGVREPARFAAMMVPGFARPVSSLPSPALA